MSYKDHLGNIRLSYSDNNGDGNIVASSDPTTNEIIEENNYYPFGLKHKGYNANVSANGNSVAQRYKFGGKEYDESFNGTLNTYDFGARNYDPALGRWMNLDPLAEQMRRHSPYNYAFDNPIYFTDPDGMAPDTVIITGDEAEKTTKQLNASTSLEITRNSKTGIISATGEAKTDADKILLNAINDENVTVSVDATSSNEKGDYSLFGGSFDGNFQVSDNGSVIAEQTVNPNQAEIIENFAGAKEGSVVTHEILEAYVGGVKTLNTSGSNGSPNSSSSGSVYPLAHSFVNTLSNLNVEGLMNSQGIEVKGAISDRNVKNNTGTITATLSKPDGSKVVLFVNKNTKL